MLAWCWAYNLCVSLLKACRVEVDGSIFLFAGLNRTSGLANGTSLCSLTYDATAVIEHIFIGGGTVLCPFGLWTPTAQSMTEEGVSTRAFDPFFEYFESRGNAHQHRMTLRWLAQCRLQHRGWDGRSDRQPNNSGIHAAMLR